MTTDAEPVWPIVLFEHETYEAAILDADEDLLGGIEPANAEDASFAFDSLLRHVRVSVQEGPRFHARLSERAAPDSGAFRLLARMCIARYGDNARWAGVFRPTLVSACHIDVAAWSDRDLWDALRRLITTGMVGAGPVRDVRPGTPADTAEPEWPVLVFPRPKSATAYANSEQLRGPVALPLGSRVFDDDFSAWQLADGHVLRRVGDSVLEPDRFRWTALEFLDAVSPASTSAFASLPDRSLQCEILARSHFSFSSLETK